MFTTISQIKEHIGGGGNMSLELDSLRPTWELVAQNDLQLWLGPTTYAALLAYVLEADETGNDDFDLLLPYVRRPLALWTMAEYAKIGGIQFGESGMSRVEIEGRAQPYKYQENAYKEYMLNHGWNALETMLIFLEDNRDTYTDWATEARPRHRSLFINTAAELRDCYARYTNRYTFESIRPIIQDMEVFFLIPSIGIEQYTALKAVIATNNLDEPQTEAVARLSRALAHVSVKEALTRNLVAIKGHTLIQIEMLEPQSYAKESPPTINTVSLAHTQLDEFAQRHLDYAIQYLTDNPTEFPEYAAYAAALAAAAATTAAAADPVDSSWTYESREPNPWLQPQQEYTPRTGKKIINF
jgi:hypothetical protein